MKILHIITSIADSGGSEKLMEELLPGLKREGFNVSCLVFNGFDSNNRKVLEKEGIQIYELSHHNRYYNPIFILKIIPYLSKFDVVHAHNTPAVIFTAIASLFCTTRLVMTVHSTEGRLRKSWWGVLIEKWVLSRYNTIICCSKIAEDTLLEKYPNLNNTITINNGINLYKYYEATPSEELLNYKGKKITMVARFRKEKNHQAVIKALHYLPEDYHLFFVGDGETVNVCLNYAKGENTNDRVHFMGLRTDVPSILKASDFIVLSSRYEGLSLSSVEGMAVGKPFIASNVNGLREVVGGAGILFPEGDSKALADIIINLEKNPDMYKEIAEKCLVRARQYDISNMIIGYKRVYNSTRL